MIAPARLDTLQLSSVRGVSWGVSEAGAPIRNPGPRRTEGELEI